MECGNTEIMVWEALVVEASAEVLQKIATTLYNKLKNTKTEKNIEFIESVLLNHELVKKIKNHSISKEKEIEIQAQLGNYLMNIVFDPKLTKKKKIVEFEVGQIIKDVEYISFYPKLKLDDLSILKLVFDAKNNMLKFYEEILVNSKNWFANNESHDRFAKVLQSHFRQVLSNDPIYTDYPLYFHYKQILSNSVNSIEFSEINIKETEATSAMKKPNDRDNSSNRRIYFKETSKIKINYDKEEIKKNELMSSLNRLESANLINFVGYGASFGPAPKEYVSLKEEGLIFENWLRNHK